jgi:hypothetical protein
MTPSPPLLRVAIVGLDHWYLAFSFARAVAGHHATELTAIVDDDLDRARELAQRVGVGVESASTDREPVLDDETVDVVASFVSVDQNPAVSAAAVLRGKHLVSVKPLARTLGEATELREAVRRAGVLFLPTESRPGSPGSTNGSNGGSTKAPSAGSSRQARVFGRGCRTGGRATPIRGGGPTPSGFPAAVGSTTPSTILTTCAGSSGRRLPA